MPANSRWDLIRRLRVNISVYVRLPRLVDYCLFSLGDSRGKSSLTLDLFLSDNIARSVETRNFLFRSSSVQCTFLHICITVLFRLEQELSLMSLPSRRPLGLNYPPVK